MQTPKIKNKKIGLWNIYCIINPITELERGIEKSGDEFCERDFSKVAVLG
jgi:hypothetical protein